MELDFTKSINKKAYQIIAKEYHKQTKNLDMKWQQEMFLEMIPQNGTILDLMCGSGRDLKKFESKGYDVTGVDQVREMLEIANKEAPTATLIQQDATELNLHKTYDGIWCSAGIFMLSKQVIPQTIKHITNHLKKDGALYINCKLGNKEEGAYNDKRYGVKRFETYFQGDELKELIEDANLDVRREMISYAQNPKYRTNPFKDYFCVKN